MENFQRYFLMFSILIFSYFLLIRWDPPTNNFTQDNVYNDSERSLVQPSNDYKETTPFNEDLSYIEPLAEICSLENIETLRTPYWSLDIDLKNGEIVSATLDNLSLIHI